MAYYNRQNFCEEDRMSYSQESYGGGGGFMGPYNNNSMQMQMTECDTYSSTGYGSQGGYGYQGGYMAPPPAYNSGSSYQVREEVDMEMSMSTGYSGGRRHHGFF